MPSRWATSAALALGLLIGAGPPAGAETVRATAAEVAARLPAAEVVRAAKVALLGGDAAAARALAAALTARHPDHREALVVLSLAEAALGNGPAAFDAGRRAHALSDTPQERFEAARAAARGAYVAGQYARSQFWLRRAAVSADSPADTARTARDFRLARSKQALVARFNFGFSRSDNLNGGASGGLLTVDGVPFVGFLSGDAQALSGQYAWTSLTGAWRLAESGRQRTELTFRLYTRNVFLSDEARAQAPLAENGDFALTAAAVGLGRRQLLRDGLELSGAVELGQQTFGGEVTHRHLGAQLGLTRRVSATGAVTLEAGLERRALGESGDRMETQAELVFGYSGAVRRAGRLRLQLRVARTESDVSNNQNTALEARAGFDLARPLGPVRISVDLGAGRSDFPLYSMGLFPVPDGRQDTRLFGAIDFVPTKIQWAGFSPVLTITASRTQSNVSRFDSGEVAFTLGVRSAF